MVKTTKMDIYKQAEKVWIITTNDDRILILLTSDGDLEFYRAEDVDDIS